MPTWGYHAAGSASLSILARGNSSHGDTQLTMFGLNHQSVQPCSYRHVCQSSTSPALAPAILHEVQAAPNCRALLKCTPHGTAPKYPQMIDFWGIDVPGQQ